MKNLKRLAWATDTHLNLTTDKRISKFCESILESEADAVILTGDIAESDCVVKHLKLLASKVGNKPIFFVLGNHDYYKTSIDELHQEVRAGLQNHPTIRWLSTVDYVPLTPSTALVGHENWWDGRAGSVTSTGLLDGLIMAPDYTLIKDFAFMWKEDRFKVLRALADEAADRITEKLKVAFLEFSTVYLAVHVPPYEQACLHGGKKMEKNWLPHFCHARLGERLTELMILKPSKQLIVLAGHTHEEMTCRPQDNIKVKVASANYFKPKLFKVLKTD